MRVELARWQGKLVVVKQLQAASPVLANRLGREAAVVTHLEHENIVPLLAVQDTSLIYAYCPGVSLSEALQAGPPRYREQFTVYPRRFSRAQLRARAKRHPSRRQTLKHLNQR